MVSIVARGMLAPECWALWVSSVECRSLVACGIAVHIVETHWAGGTHVESKQAPPLVSLSSFYL